MEHPIYVFSGDSVTDCSRKRGQRFANTPEALGTGWVSRLNTTLNASQKVATLYNRGFSGCRVAELHQKEAWWPDGIVADVTTLLIGINDIWHPIDQGRPHQIPQALEAFEQLLIELNKRSNTVVVCEPLALPTGEVDGRWWEPLNELTKGQRLICQKLGANWLALQDDLLSDAHGRLEDYLYDGVHPTDLGHRWLAKKWIAFAMAHHLLSE